MLRGSSQNQTLLICVYVFGYLVFMGLIHCGFGVFLFLTHNLILVYSFIYIVDVIQYILCFVPCCLCKLLGLCFMHICRLYGLYHALCSLLCFI